MPVFLFFLLYTISVYTALGERVALLSAVRHELLMGFVLSASCILLLTSNPIPLKTHRVIVTAIILLFVAMLTQIPFALDQSQAWPTFFDKVFKQALFAMFIVTLVRTPKHLKWFMCAFLFSLFYIYQESVYGLITGGLVWYNQGISRLHGAVAIYGHANGISRIAVTCLPFLVFLIPVTRRFIYKVVLVGIGALAIPCIVYSGSRAGYVGVIGVLGFWWLMCGNKMRGVLLGVAMGAVVLVAMPQQYQERFMSIGGQEKAGHSKDTRIQIVRDSIDILKEYPLGVGIESFILVRIRKFGRVQDTHNLWLQAATHLGIQGFLIFCFFLAALVRGFIQVNHRLERLATRITKFTSWSAPPPRQRKGLRNFLQEVRYTRAVSRGTLLYLIMLMLNGTFAHSLYLIDWWLCAGLAISLLHITTNLEREFHLLTRSLETDATTT